MTRHADRILGALLFMALAGCSALSPDKGVPPAPAGLEYPSVGNVPAHPGQPVLSKEQRQKLETDLERYKVGTD